MPENLIPRLREFSEKVRGELPALLFHYRSATNAGNPCYINQPGKPRRVRPWCDAIEIASAFGLTPEGRSAAEWIKALQSFQDPATGLVPEHIPDDSRFDPPAPNKPSLKDRYNTMAVRYALECLGSPMPHLVHHSENIDAACLIATLDSLTWKESSWGAGHWIDCYASCLDANRLYFHKVAQLETLFAWLNSHVDPVTGLWGNWTKAERWLQPVNGFYRLTRGTYAQFGRPLPAPERAIDTLLLHMDDPEFFASGRGNACNVLDVVHPLWLCSRQTKYRFEEGRVWVEERLAMVIDRWTRRLCGSEIPSSMGHYRLSGGSASREMGRMIAAAGNRHEQERAR